MKFFFLSPLFFSHALEIYVVPSNEQLCPPVYNFNDFGCYSFDYYLFWCFLKFNFFQFRPWAFYIIWFLYHFLSFLLLIALFFFMFYTFLDYFFLQFHSLSFYCVYFFNIILVLVLLITIFLLCSWFIFFIYLFCPSTFYFI